MNKKAIFFDLDGTLLPMDLQQFLKAFFSCFAGRLASSGYGAEELYGAVSKSMYAVIFNDGKRLNEQVFWESFTACLGEDVINSKDEIVQFYHEDFNRVKQVCGFDRRAKEVVELCKKLGYRLILATNPIYPAIATHARIGWAGLDKGDFEYITTYENSRFCKPNINYYADLLTKLDLKAEQCVMVGNDVEEDMVAGELGFDLFLLTDCVINKHGRPIDKYPHGGFDDLIAYIKNLK